MALHLYIQKVLFLSHLSRWLWMNSSFELNDTDYPNYLLADSLGNHIQYIVGHYLWPTDLCDARQHILCNLEEFWYCPQNNTQLREAQTYLLRYVVKVHCNLPALHKLLPLSSHPIFLPQCEYRKKLTTHNAIQLQFELKM